MASWRASTASSLSLSSYRIPLLMLVSHRGGFGEEHPWQTEGGGVTEHVLDAQICTIWKAVSSSNATWAAAVLL